MTIFGELFIEQRTMLEKPPKCIFCKKSSVNFTTKEHILPQSLGGGSWALLPQGMFCDPCQNRFGSVVEKHALNDYPFSFLRVFLGIPTKKRKSPWFKSWEGIIRSSFQNGLIEYEPAPQFRDAVNQNTKTVMRIIAEPQRPEMICRFLLKMGIEIVALNSPMFVFDRVFDPARKFALTGRKSDIQWWYVQNERVRDVECYIKKGYSESDCDRARLEIIEIGEGQFMFHFHFLYLNLLCPLTEQIIPEIPHNTFELRLFKV